MERGDELSLKHIPKDEELELGAETATGGEDEVEIKLGDSNQPRAPIINASAGWIMNVVLLLVSAGAASAVAGWRVEHLAKDYDTLLSTNQILVSRMSQVEAKMDLLVEEVRYLRSRADRIAEMNERDRLRALQPTAPSR